MTASDELSAALNRIANDSRRQASTFANITPRAGSSRVPRRLMSDIGFLTETQFNYIAVNAAHAIYNDTGDPRAIDRFLLLPYGGALDRARFRVTPAVRARLSSISGTDFFTPVYTTEEKTNAAVRSMTTSSGPAFHFLVSRAGDIFVGPAADGVLTNSGPTGIAIGLELQLATTADRTFNVSLPLSGLQLVTLATLLAKLYTAYPGVPRQRTSGNEPGLHNDNELPLDTVENSPFTYLTPQELFSLVLEEGDFDLATEVWRPLMPQAPVATRAQARAAIGQVDTTGAVSALLGAYVDVASRERTGDMQGVLREQMFVRRVRVSHRDADEAGTAAADAAASGTAAALPSTPAVGTEPETYDFTTGLWGDGRPY